MDFELDANIGGISTGLLANHHYGGGWQQYGSVASLAAASSATQQFWCRPMASPNDLKLLSVWCDSLNSAATGSSGSGGGGSVVDGVTSSASNTSHPFAGGDPFANEFKCELSGTNYDIDNETNQANYACYQGRACVNINVANVINPIAEFILNVPKSVTTLLWHSLEPPTTATTTTSESIVLSVDNDLNQASDNQSFCDKILNQVFQCNGILSNYTFYENDTFNYHQMVSSYFVVLKKKAGIPFAGIRLLSILSRFLLRFLGHKT